MKRSYKLFLKIFLIFSLLISLGAGVFFYQDPLLNCYFRLTPFFYWNYAKDKALVSPYFDEAFYRSEYDAALQQSGQDPLDHFMQRSCRWGGGDFDPNPWFNTTLYRERLWPCAGNAFVDFLRQPSLKVPKKARSVEIYANPAQFYRAGIAVEGFMRMNTLKVMLVLPEALKGKVPLCFQPQIKRGLEVRFSNDPHLSFYHSPFLKDPDDGYGVTNLPATDVCEVDSFLPTTRFRRHAGYDYLVHGFLSPAWRKKKDLINPCMLNFAHKCSEPIMFFPISEDEYGFKKAMQRLAPAFDLMFINCDIGTQNLRLIPGYMAAWNDPQDLPQKKQYGVSFLLSFARRGMSVTQARTLSRFRAIVWHNEKKIPLPTHFYISRRDMEKYPEYMKKRALPTRSKKWVFGSQFHIAIENAKQKDYFTEKLLGAFLSLCVPIYIGCPNITDYFDERGMFIAEDPDDVLKILNTLTPETYQKMLPYLLENKRRAEKFLTLEDRYIEDFYRDNIMDSSSTSSVPPQGCSSQLQGGYAPKGGS